MTNVILYFINIILEKINNVTKNTSQIGLDDKQIPHANEDVRRIIFAFVSNYGIT